ncbi:uncharacterized protein FIESC28_02783 [Fusarium coffeatum]|uniref:Uncharacterized protein n=1 Tax=Fusarium coffeatum TaxID=231269 RepID=A0A366S4P4_9HYPO|nr:uncharacterized protein FIESC28_02783 [Fusarium coffeatum]RBR24293.1 hypothetical protein FIESC28_02783 [Fusarium coffeatum]
MKTEKATTTARSPMLGRFISHQDESESGVQGRLILGTLAPSVAEKTTEMNIKLQGLGHEAVAVNLGYKDKMTQELDHLLGGK